MLLFFNLILNEHTIKMYLCLIHLKGGESGLKMILNFAPT